MTQTFHGLGPTTRQDRTILGLETHDSPSTEETTNYTILPDAWCTDVILGKALLGPRASVAPAGRALR